VALAIQPAPGSRIFPQFAAGPGLSTTNAQEEDDELGLLALLDRELEDERTSSPS